jgi:hypothetical protein
VPASDQVGPITRKIVMSPSYGHPRDDAHLTNVTRGDPKTGNAMHI